VVVATGAISRANLQSNRHRQQTNTQLFPGRMPFLSPNQHCQSTEVKISYSMDLLTASSPGGLPTLSLTTSSSWLPWGRVAIPLISPLMPVPQFYVHVFFVLKSRNGSAHNAYKAHYGPGSIGPILSRKRSIQLSQTANKPDQVL